MTAKELIKELKSFDPDTEVIMSKDAEGNAHSPLSGVYTADNPTDTEAF